MDLPASSTASAKCCSGQLAYNKDHSIILSIGVQEPEEDASQLCETAFGAEDLSLG